MGCCAGIKPNLNINKDILIRFDDKNENEIINIKEPYSDFQNFQKTDKGETKKEKPLIKLNDKKSDIDDTNKSKNTTNKISSKVKVEEIKNKFKPNKNRVIKKDSLRVQQAMRELKLISLEEITSNKKYFS